MEEQKLGLHTNPAVDHIVFIFMDADMTSGYLILDL